MMRRIAYITLFTITVFQTSCSTLLYETHKDDPILQLDQNYSVHLEFYYMDYKTSTSTFKCI